jgi:TRAP-type C4-dicarboxylate transport system permease small subunit
MNKNLFIVIIGVLVPVVMAAAFGYWAWVSRSAFMSLYSFITNWDDFNLMTVTLFASSFLAGISVAAIAMIISMRRDARREQEKERLKQEVKKELEMEAKKEALI